MRDLEGEGSWTVELPVMLAPGRFSRTAFAGSPDRIVVTGILPGNDGVGLLVIDLG